ncbi:MAG: M20/M25/M40 family metallo-hydrolase [Erysipelotrichaceae bacterium]
MKEKIKEQASNNLEDLIKSIKIICGMDSRRGEYSKQYPFGENVAKCLQEVLRIGDELGFETYNYDNIVGEVSFGPDTKEYIGIVGHLDVVDINGVWKSDPFTCAQIDNTLYARGVLDNKGPILACLYALKTLKDLNIKFPIKVKVLFGTNEETGMEDMNWFFKDHPYPSLGFTPDCKYPVVYAERGRAQIKISYPYTALDKYLKFINNYIMNQTDLSNSLGLDYEDEEFGKNQIRKIILTEGNNYLNVELITSYPATYSCDQMIKSIIKIIDEEAKVELMSNLEPVFFEKESFLIKTLEKAYENIMMEEGKAVTTTGGTYAKVIKNIVPFGPSFKGQKNIAHLPNEWMKISDIEKNMQIYAYAIYLLMDFEKGENA